MLEELGDYKTGMDKLNTLLSNTSCFIAVGFYVNLDRSCFYIKEKHLSRFMKKLGAAILNKYPDFVSIRIPRKKSPQP